MEVAEFLDRLYETPRDWRLHGLEITRETDTCPWLAVCSGLMDAVKQGDEILDDAIWDAADGRPGHDPKIRRALLAACGLASLLLALLLPTPALAQVTPAAL